MEAPLCAPPSKRAKQSAGTLSIMGIDPGLQKTGWSVIALGKDSRLLHLASGTIATKAKNPLALRLLHIAQELSEEIQKWKPDEASIENALVGQGADAALKLGHARAAVLIALASHGLNPEAYPPSTIKKAVTGRGNADKSQVAFMVSTLLPAAKPKNDHEADAISAALCHLQRRKVAQLSQTTGI